MPTLYSTSTPAKIPSIDTIYKGYRFRSRLEARWAVFFDHLKLNWVYEHEGYALPSGWYLPDFWFPDEYVIVEIKHGPQPTNAQGRPDFDTREQKLMDEIVREVEDIDGGLVLYGDPLDVMYNVVDRRGLVELGHNCARLFGFEERLTDKLFGRECQAAALAARQARFEHGERP